MSAFFWRGVRLSLSAAVVGAAALVLGAACGGDDGGDSGKVQVVTTLPLFADFVREVGGERVEVTSLVPAGADPHTWEPSPSDVKKVTEADIAFANGLDLEPSAIKLIEANLKDRAPFVKLGEEALGDSIEPGVDPHVWMDPRQGDNYARRVQDELIRLDPDGFSVYAANFDQYLRAALDMYSHVVNTTDRVVGNDRWLITTHDAFGRLADAIGYNIKAFVVAGPGQEPSPEDVRRLTEAIRDYGVKAVFREPQLDSEGRVLEQAAKDAGVAVCTLYSDSLDDRVTSYIEMMRFNADEIARCLGGESDG